MSQISIKCETGDYLLLSEITPFFSSLKHRKPGSIRALAETILRDGFIAPIFIWRSDKNYILDGNGRYKALAELEKQHTVPPIPVVFIDADSEAEARRKMVEVNSLNGFIQKDELLEFAAGIAHDYKNLPIRNVDMSDVLLPCRSAYDEAYPKPPELPNLEHKCPKCGVHFPVQ